VTWFETLTGFAETSPRDVRANLELRAPNQLVSKVNGRVLTFGVLETPTLGELRQRVRGSSLPGGRITVREIVADVRSLHADPLNTGALFQVASQFNLLEMMHPGVTPEHGVGIYENDRTQGPACAIACGAGTIYRNYFAPVNGQTGQSSSNQIDCLAGLGEALGENRLWEMRNGYALPSPESLARIAVRLRASSPDALDDLRQRLRIGLQWRTEVTLPGCSHLVTQAYCSALPVAYARHSTPDLWEPFARLVLDAAYEATLCAAILNSATASRTLFLTLLGGGAFGNTTEWIVAAIRRALDLYRDAAPLNIAIVSYGSPKPFLKPLLS
jgi:hypothetical protein